MPTYRNITEETLFVDLGRGSLVRVDAGEVLVASDAEDAARYFQTGDTGESPLWEPVTTSKTKKAAPDAAESE